MQFAVAMNRELQYVGERVDHRHTDAVQTTGNFVRAIVEFSARVQHGHDHFGGGTAFLGVNIDRNSAAVVLDGDRLVGVNSDHHAVAMTG